MGGVAAEAGFERLLPVLLRDGMRAAIERSLATTATDARLEELPLGAGALESLHGGCVNLAVVVVGRLQADDHVPLCLVVADAGDVAVFVHISAGESVQRDSAVVLHLDDFSGGGLAYQKQYCKQNFSQRTSLIKY